MNRLRARVVTALFAVCLCIFAGFAMAPAASAETVIEKISVRTSRNCDPRVLDTVNEHCSTETGMTQVYTSPATWYNSDGSVASGLFSEGVYTVEIPVHAAGGYCFSQYAYCTINNDSATMTYIDAANVVVRRSITVNQWNGIQLWKNPADEYVKDYTDIASFVTTGAFFTDVTWNFTDRDGAYVSVDSARSRFSDVQIDVARPDENTARINIKNVPLDMDGWMVHATLSNPSTAANTKKATIHVELPSAPEIIDYDFPLADELLGFDPAAEATDPAAPAEGTDPAPQEPAADPTAEEAAAGEEMPPEEFPEDTHEHLFTAAWKSDVNGHWHECDCGEKNEFGAHEMEWSVATKATKKESGMEKGMCSVCGYTDARELPAEGGDSLAGRIFIIGIGAVAVLVLFILIEQIKYNKKKKARKAYRNRYR